jgi:hypothetical protein
MKQVTVRHMGSGHRYVLPIIDFLPNEKALTVRWGPSGCYEFSLATGQGLNVAKWYVIDEIDQVREHARKRGVTLPLRREPVAPRKQTTSARRVARARKQTGGEDV